MHQATKPASLAALLPLGAVVCVVNGCLPIPHHTPRAAAVQGRILDAQTYSPILGAEISLAQKPHHPTYTDTKGYFRLKETRNFHWAYVPPEGDWPDRKNAIIVVHDPRYEAHVFSAPVDGQMNAGDILLRPE